MAKKKSTQEIIDAWLDYKKAGFEMCWSFRWRPGHNKRAAAEAWNNWITSEALCNRVVHGAREYTLRYAGNPYIKGFSVWVNAEGWNDELPAEKKEEIAAVSEYCECGQIATQRREGLCAACWSNKYGTIRYAGKTFSAHDLLRATLKKIGMEPRDGETRDEWHGRCRDYALKHKSKVGVGGPSRV